MRSHLFIVGTAAG